MLLELAERLQEATPPYSLKFIAFGSEEQGLLGSTAYTKQMTSKDIQATIAMMNLDTLVGGDKMYVHSGANNKGWLRDKALKLAKTRSIDLETNPGLNPLYPKGTTGDWGDHEPFHQLGIEIATFETTNWEIGELDGYEQTEKYGSIWHTEKDTLSFLEKAFPGRVQQQLADFVFVLDQLLL